MFSGLEDVINNMLAQLEEELDILRSLYLKPVSVEMLEDIEIKINDISYIVYRYLYDDLNEFKKYVLECADE